MALYNDLSQLTYLVETAVSVRDQASDLAKGLKPKDKTRKALEEVTASYNELRANMVSTNEAGWLSGEEKLREELANLYAGVTAFEGRPSQTQLDRKKVLETRLDEFQTHFNSLRDQGVAELNRTLAKKGMELLKVQSKEEWEADDF